MSTETNKAKVKRANKRKLSVDKVAWLNARTPKRAAVTVDVSQQAVLQSGPPAKK